jgi:hypothetical protein
MQRQVKYKETFVTDAETLTPIEIHWNVIFFRGHVTQKFIAWDVNGIQCTYHSLCFITNMITTSTYLEE